MTAIRLSTTGKPVALERGNPEFEAAAAQMAEEYAAGAADLRRAADAVRAAAARMRAAFEPELAAERISFNPFDVSLSCSGGHRNETIDAILDRHKRAAWRLLFDRLGVKKVMSVAKRDEFDKRLESGDLPEVTAAIVDVILGMVDAMPDFARDAAKEVFEILRPWRSGHKTNSAFRVGRKVILAHYMNAGWGDSRFRVCHYREQKLIAIDGVFHVLAGEGVMGERKGPLVAAIESSKEGKGETEFFRWKGFKNGNLHLEFKRLPSYSPQLNPSERFWKKLRRRATHNRLFDTPADLKTALRTSLGYFQTVRSKVKSIIHGRPKRKTAKCGSHAGFMYQSDGGGPNLYTSRTYSS